MVNRFLVANLTPSKKLRVARALGHLASILLKPVFPISSPGDFNSVEEISKSGFTSPTICALTCRSKDIDVAADALALAKHKRIHTGIGVSHEHIYSKLKSNPEEIIERAVAAVRVCQKVR